FGSFESPDKEYPNQLRDSLKTRGCFDVINAGIAGAGLMSITRLWENYAAAFHPAVVVIYPSPSSYGGDKAPTWPSVPGTPEKAADLPFRPRLIEHFHNAWSTPPFLQRYRLQRTITAATAGKPSEW